MSAGINTHKNKKMISELNQNTPLIAQQIYAVFQNSYQVEADLIGTDNFPPLKRTIDDIKISDTVFYGFYLKERLTAVIEVALRDNHLNINSLTVDPKYFRRGIASLLIDYVLTGIEFTKATVETAVVNGPAIKLYQKHGFTEFKRYTPSHGIEKLAMVLR
jgi:ribosomal protein S18 acetylase RimI-like enzyme